MDISVILFSKPTTGNFLVDIVLWLVTITSSIAWGVILFTLILKLITLPFDYVSRASTRKNSIRMEEMRPELEKLQQQYADNKELYNQKMMALYKKNGYSMWGACLPTIITLVIFIVAINGFNDYSKYQNKKYFFDMSVAYNSVIYDGIKSDGTYIVKNAEDGSVTIYIDKITEKVGNLNVGEIGQINLENHSVFAEKKVNTSTDGSGTVIQNYYKVYTTDSYIYSDVYVNEKDGKVFTSYFNFHIDETNLLGNNSLKLNGKTYAEFKSTDVKEKRAVESDREMESAVYFVKEIGRTNASDAFHGNGSRFLWIKNIWVTDSSMAHPIEDCKTFNSKYGQPEGSGCGCSCANNIQEAIRQSDYDELTSKLGKEKTEPNGYFILVILTAGISLLTQFVMSRGQKAQMELQTVNGQGAQTQKMMMWMMPVMMAVFAFMYTAAFSIYIILSSAISMLTTIAINKITDKRFKKKNDDGGVTHSRVFTPKEEPKKDTKSKKNKRNKNENEADFLSGKADKNKRIRGRLK